MTTSSARARRVAAAVSSGSLVLLALSSATPTAGAVSAEIAYSCTAGDTPFTMGVTLDTTAPVRMTTGQSTQLTVTAKVTLPKSTAERVAGGPVTHAAATLKPAVTFGTAPTVVTQTAPRTMLSESPASQLSGSSAPFTYTAPTSSGTLEITAGALTGTLKLDDDAEDVPEREFSCAAPHGKPPLIDTIAVAASTSTTLTLSRSTSAHGQGVTASSKVVASSGSPVGDVAFAVDGIVTRARVDKDGIASAVLPDAAVGAHTVLATFVPNDVASFVGSTSVTKLWAVGKAETKARIPVTGRTTRTATRVGVKVRGVFDTVPTGKVRITVKRLGKPGRWVKSRTLDDAGTARLRLRLRAAGRYRVVATYRGDANHLAEKKAKTFRVVRR